jgi:uncharacterized protein (DUF1499 family)
MNTRISWLWKLQLLWLVLALVAVIAFRLTLFPWRPTLLLVAAATAGLILTGFMSLLVLFVLLRGRRSGGRLCLAAAALSLPALIVVLLLGLQGAKAPPIHDITTDPDNPPLLRAAQQLRRAGDNPVGYEGAVVADQQRRAYADIGPLVITMPPAQAFERCRAVAGQLRWRIVAEHPQQGEIEAIDQSLLFGFIDDIVIRVKATDSGSRIDLRSASRAGVSDLGVNAKRIRSFIQAFNSSQVP